MKKPVRIFISYAREDVDSARKLATQLEALDAQPWLDERFLQPGHRWRSKVKEAIAQSNYFIALLSTHSVTKRGFVQNELKQALDLLDEFPQDAIFLIPVRLDNCQPTHEKLKDIHWADLFPDWDEGFRRIASAMGLNLPIRTDQMIAHNRPLNVNIAIHKGFLGYWAELLFYYEIPKKRGLSEKGYSQLLKQISGSINNTTPFSDLYPERVSVLIESMKAMVPEFVGHPQSKTIVRKPKAETWTRGVYTTWYIDVIVEDTKRDQQIYKTASTGLDPEGKGERPDCMSLFFYPWVGDEVLWDENAKSADETVAEVWQSQHFAKIDAAFKTMLKHVLPVWFERLQHKNIIIESRLDENYYDPDVAGLHPRILYSWWAEDDIIT